MSNVIDFEQIEKGGNDSFSIEKMIEVQEKEAETFSRKLASTAAFCRQVAKIAEETIKKSGVTGDFRPTPVFITMLATPIDAIIGLGADNNEKSFPIMTAEADDGFTYVIKLHIVTTKIGQKSGQVFDYNTDVITSMFRVKGKKCECVGSDGKWNAASWRDYMGITYAQYIDVEKNPIHADMLSAAMDILGPVSDKRWKKIKEENRQLISLYKNPGISRLMFISADEVGNRSGVRFTLQPYSGREGAAIGIKDESLTLLLQTNDEAVEVCTFADEEDAENFIEKYFDRYSDSSPSFVLPLSRDKVIDIRLADASVDLDDYVRKNFGPLTEREKKLLRFSKKAIRELAEQDILSSIIEKLPVD